METDSNLRSIGLARGVVMHLFDLDGERSHTLCNRRIGINPRQLDDRYSWTRPAEEATCQRCRKLAGSA